MAETIVNAPSGDSSAGWFVAALMLAVVLVGGFFLYRYYGAPRAAAPSSTNINVTIPNPLDQAAGGTQGGAGNTNQ